METPSPNEVRNAVVEVRVVRTAFADILGAMREWLDRYDSPGLVQFETEADADGYIIIKTQFDSHDFAERFRQAFRGFDGVHRGTGIRPKLAAEAAAEFPDAA